MSPPLAPCPGDFLTFYRRLLTSQRLRQPALARPTAARPFTVSAYRPGAKVSNFKTEDAKMDAMPDDQHTTKKNDRLDVQTNNSAAGRESKSQDAGGQATQQKDTRNSTAKAKKEHPEAPDVVIGMQDERGGKGH